jgi:predicted 3-demethylubiquinone-9 3-methyltransferase (glyoxalase superfamily)
VVAEAKADGGSLSYYYSSTEGEDQAEADAYWDALIAGGGTPGHCGWLKDPFGVSWQVVPMPLMELLGDPDPVRAARAHAAMLTQSRLDLAAMRAAMDADD